MTTKVKKKASPKVATKTTSKPVSKAAAKAVTKTRAKTPAKTSSSKTSKGKAKASVVKMKKPQNSKMKSDAYFEDEMDFGAEDFYSVSDGLTITAPSQPLEYKVLVGESAEDLTRKVNELLYVAWDGTVWVPVGGLTQVNGKWAQAMARFE